MSALDVPSILFISLGLSADCFVVALSGSISMRSVSFLQKIRASLTFGVFQALMPVLGWLAGRTVVDLISDYDHWVAFILLVLIGIRMIWGSTHRKEDHNKVDITRGLILLTLAVATSIDALAVGLTFAFLEVSITLASSLIGIVAFMITMLGFAIGRKAGELIGKRAEAIGGVILIIIGLRILLNHIL
ncbi:manganese efflux pump MntP family protein [Chloroflexota bacterium]